MWERISDIFLQTTQSPWLSLGIIILAVIATGHILLFKRSPRGAVAWLAVIWLEPLVGIIFYWIFGINRISRKAYRLRGLTLPKSDSIRSLPTKDFPHAEFKSFFPLMHAGDQLKGSPLSEGNRITPLFSGDEAYPLMLDTIDSAKQSITLLSYIFDNDPTGHRFLEALQSAVDRGVQVRLLIDDIGASHTVPSIFWRLKNSTIPYAKFLPASLMPWSVQFLNLRNHRKLLIVDGKQCFTGGMNISHDHWLEMNPKNPVNDIHFLIEGPLVKELQEVFCEDWYFTTGEHLEGNPWFGDAGMPHPGKTLARAVSDGPDVRANRIRWHLIGAITSAKESVRIMNPYFLPDSGLITSLNQTALKGASVEIILPAHTDNRAVDYATRAMLWQLLESGCRVWYSPKPFDHTKIMIVDDQITHFGSANIDPRSLRLNFELNVEAFDEGLARRMTEHFERVKAVSSEISIQQMDNRPLYQRLRDGAARLFSPFL